MERLLAPGLVLALLLPSGSFAAAQAPAAPPETAPVAPMQAVPPAPAPGMPAGPMQAAPTAVQEPTPYAAPAAVPPPPGYPPYGAQQAPFVYTANGWVATDPVATSASLDRAEHGLGIEKVGILVGAVGMATQFIGYAFLFSATTCGTYDCYITDPSRYDAAAVVAGVGWGLATGGLVAGGSGALMASNQLRALGVPNHRRGLAIASLVLGFFPFHLPAFIMETVHASRTRALVRDLRLTVAPRVTYGFVPMTNPEMRSFGTRFVLRF